MRLVFKLAIVAAVLGAASAHADGVYLGVGNRGVLHFDGSNVRTVTRKPKYAHRLASNGSDTLWVADVLAVHRFVNGKRIDVDVPRIALFMTSQRNVLWLGNEKEIAWNAGDLWHSRALPREKAGLLKDFAVDNQGRAWIVFEGRLLFLGDSDWTPVALPSGLSDANHCRIAATGADIYLFGWEQVFRLRDNTWSEVAKLDKVLPLHVHAATDGTLSLIGFTSSKHRAFVIKPDGSVANTFDLPSGWTTINAFGVDARGHLWIGATRGLAVFDQQGTRLRLPPTLPTREEIHAIHFEGVGPK